MLQSYKKKSTLARKMSKNIKYFQIFTKRGNFARLSAQHKQSGKLATELQYNQPCCPLTQWLRLTK